MYSCHKPAFEAEHFKTFLDYFLSALIYTKIKHCNLHRFHNVSHYLLYHDQIFKSRVPWLETNQRHCAVPLEKDTLAMVQPREHSNITEISMIIKRYKRVVYNMDIMRQYSCLVVKPNDGL